MRTTMANASGTDGKGGVPGLLRTAVQVVLTFAAVQLVVTGFPEELVIIITAL